MYFILNLATLQLVIKRIKKIKEELKFNSNSRVFLINTEGDTDQENYRAICWDGAY